MPLFIMQITTSRLHKILIFQNNNNKKFFKKFHLCNIKNTKIIYGSGVDFKNPDVPNKPIYKKKNRLIKIILVTRILREKGILEFLKLVEVFDKNSSNFSFSLIGGLDENNKFLKNTIEKCEKRYKNFKWFGQLGTEQVQKLLIKSDIFLYPSTYSEGIPRVLLEAANYNLYIISYDMPGCNEIVIDKVNGELIDYGQPIDAFVKAIKSFSNINSEMMIFNKLLIKNKFDMKVISNSYVSVYSEIINKMI